jgi:7,8-dihydropterin-6-yl-methyl-4-(beta-D-ribofuranosyl)aminobenzene 5'-phosphate synthase
MEMAPQHTATTAMTPAPTALPSPTVATEDEKVIITVVYDNNAYDPRLQTAWGFGCVIERDETTVLFDTGGDGAILLSNMAALGFDPRVVDIVVLSHIHGDHTGGLADLLATGVRPTVYVPKSFPASFKTQVKAITALQEVAGPQEILPGIHTTGQMGSGIVEQALVVETPQGLVVITGCAHPGIVEMVRRAGQIGESGVYLVLGGFHLGGASARRIADIIAAFREMGVQKVAPCHCTGDQAMDMFAAEYGDDFIQNGVGKILEIKP